MLDQITKRKLDSARDILVGKIPDPKAQVEQITTALIYKFMDDMDLENEEVNMGAQFFVNEYSKYSWRKLMDNRLSGQERLDLYVEAIISLQKNPHTPQLFRDIFKGVFLPFRDPRTLSLFLKEINEFSYENSENLGNAFEYLLSILGSQGDAGQFRTPRHIIDFIVEVVDPKKNEKILDPACGTAGFLISAYKHIIRENSSNYKKEEYIPTFADEENKEVDSVEIQKDGKYKGDILSPDQKIKLTQNISGYDISPDMVKLALVNLYLHGFSDPRIGEYDTLTSDKRWDDNFDVILANPPFMTPKGGISPHKRFSIQANRAEVLFVDYIAEHLSINGRAGIIVPEGIIFQSANAYKNLRKNLIENWGLYAVVSLPSGVFNPYSGVKTSILFIDKDFSKKTDEVIFLKIENDGFNLGAQRKKIDKNDLPDALDILKTFKEKKYFSHGDYKKYRDIAFTVKKNKIIENTDYNLTGDRYKVDLSELLKNNFDIITKSLEPFQSTTSSLIESNQKQIEQIQKTIQPILEQFEKQKNIINTTFVSLQEPIESMQKAFKMHNFLELQKIIELAKSKINKNKWPIVELGDVCEIYSGNTAPQDKGLFINGKYPFYRTSDVGAVHLSNNLLDVRDWLNDEGIKGLKLFEKGTILFPKSGASVFLNHRVIMGQNGYVSSHLATISVNKNLVNEKYVYYLLTQIDAKDITPDQAYPSLKISEIRQIKIPLPSLEIQGQIVADVEQNQMVVDGARQIVKNWKPNFIIDSEWEIVELGDVCEFNPKKSEIKDLKEDIFVSFVPMANLNEHQVYFDTKEKRKLKDVYSNYTYFAENDVLLARVTPCFENGKSGVAKNLENNIGFGSSEYFVYRANKERIMPEWIYYFISNEVFIKGGKNNMSGTGGLQRLTKEYAIKYKIPLPPIKVQEKLILSIESEQKIVNQNKELIEKMEDKIKNKIKEIFMK